MVRFVDPLITTSDGGLKRRRVYQFYILIINMAKKSFEKKRDYKDIAIESLKTAEIYKCFAEYREGQATLEKTKYAATFVFAILEAIVI